MKRDIIWFDRYDQSLSSIRLVHIWSNIVSGLTSEYGKRVVRTLAVRNRTTTGGSYSVTTQSHDRSRPVTQYVFTIPGVHAAIFDNHPQAVSYVPCSFRRNNVHLRKLPRIFVYDGYRKPWVSFRVLFADMNNNATSAPLISSREKHDVSPLPLLSLSLCSMPISSSLIRNRNIR